MKSFTSLVVSSLAAVLFSGCGAPEATNNSAELKAIAPFTCSIKTSGGTYLTAVGGGGRTYDVLHTDATRVGAWEKFTFVDIGDGSSRFGIRTVNGHYLTAVGGGGRITDVMHSDATRINGWEMFTLNSLGGGLYTLQTQSGHYLNAAAVTPQSSETVHSDAVRVGAWEKFRLNCGI